MSEAPKKRRRLWLFGLIAIAVFFGACLWVRSQLVLVNQRREFLRAFHNGESPGFAIGLHYRLPPNEGQGVPLLARLLGEEAIGFVWIDGRVPASEKSIEVARLKALFPEADVTDAPPQALQAYDAENIRLKRLNE